MTVAFSLLTGRFPLHVNIHNKALSIPGSGMPLGFTTIAQVRCKALPFCCASTVFLSKTAECLSVWPVRLDRS